MHSVLTAVCDIFICFSAPWVSSDASSFHHKNPASDTPSTSSPNNRRHSHRAEQNRTQPDKDWFSVGRSARNSRTKALLSFRLVLTQTFFQVKMPASIKSYIDAQRRGASIFWRPFWQWKMAQNWVGRPGFWLFVVRPIDSSLDKIALCPKMNESGKNRGLLKFRRFDEWNSRG